MLLALAAVIAGITVLARAADEFVAGSARLAHLLSMPPVVIGAVIVGFGTSAPEMLVSGIAAYEGDPDIGIGNVVGSNAANLSLILGSAALVLALGIDSSILRREGRMATLGAVVFAGLAWNGLSTIDGIILLVALAGALALVLRRPPGDNEAIDTEVGELVEGEFSVAMETVRTVVGLVSVTAGAWVLLWGATDIADRIGLADGFVGLSLVAVGTSLPELVTAIAAARHQQDELIVGNLLGSNLFNSFAVGGLVGLIGDGSVDDLTLTRISVVAMIVICVGAFGLMSTRRLIGRIEGVGLLVAFAGFLLVTYLNGGAA